MAVIETTIITKIIYDTETKLSKVTECYSEEKDFSDNSNFKPVVIRKPQKSTSVPNTQEKIDNSNKPIVQFLNMNRLVFNEAALSFCSIKPDDRLTIKYETDEKGVTYPLLAAPELFGVTIGNKITKKGTMSYGGKNGLKLSEYGDSFYIEARSPGVFRLIGNIKKDVPVEIIIPAIENKKAEQELEEKQQVLERVEQKTNVFETDNLGVLDSSMNKTEETIEETTDILDLDFIEDNNSSDTNSKIIEFPEEKLSDESIINDDDLFDLDDLIL